MKEYKSFILFYLAAVFLWGLGWIAILPPFEGFDENSHYSNIREISSRWEQPVYGLSMLDQTVMDYAIKGPMPYGTLKPPFDANMTYRKFFQSPALVDNYALAFRQPPMNYAYQPSAEISPEAIHAPLYYIWLAPFEKISRGLSFVSQILFLRIVTYIIVMAGIALSLTAMFSYGRRELIIGFLLYPLIFPTFFGEFARLGNDSLCMLICAFLAMLLNRYGKEPGNIKLSIIIGIALATGLVTKAFFIPISAALITWLLTAYVWQNKTGNRKEHLINIAVIGTIAAVCGGWWYATRLINGIPIVGFEEPVLLAKQGGLIDGLKQHFTLIKLVQGFAANIVTWIWGGTWSIVHIPTPMYIPMLVLLSMILYGFYKELRQKPLTDTMWLGVFLFVFFALGFFRHILISIAIYGTGGTPANYLHILLPWAAPMAGMGFYACTRKHLASIIMKILVFYAVLFQFSILWLQVALFSGCATKGDDKHYSFPDGSLCLNKLDAVIKNLSVIAWPQLACIGFAAGLVCFWVAYKKMEINVEQKD